MVSQQELLEITIPLFRAKGKLYEKKTKIKARPALPGEAIQTLTSDGLETKSSAVPGDMVIENPGKEKYLVSAKNFKKRYDFDKAIDETWSWYTPKGKVLALNIDQELLEFLDQPDSFYFIASWGAEMVAKKHDFLVCTPDYSEVYRIAKKEFEETYRPV